MCMLCSYSDCFSQVNPNYETDPYFLIRNVTPVLVYKMRFIYGILR